MMNYSNSNDTKTILTYALASLKCVYSLTGLRRNSISRRLKNFGCSMSQLCLLVTVGIALVCAEKCPVFPQDTPAADWNKMTGKWYLSFHNHDSIFGEGIPCCVVESVLQGTSEGLAKLAVEDHYRVGPPKQFVLDVHHLQGGLYVYTSKDVAMVERAVAFGKNGTAAKKAVEEADEFLQKMRLCITDYKAYYIMVMCKDEGDVKVWAFTSQRFPDPIVKSVVNAVLKENGIMVDLHESHCDDVDFE